MRLTSHIEISRKLDYHENYQLYYIVMNIWNIASKEVMGLTVIFQYKDNNDDFFYLNLIDRSIDLILFNNGNLSAIHDETKVNYISCSRDRH